MPSFMIDEKKNLVESQGFLLDERKNLVKDQGYVIDEKKNLVEYQGGGEVNPPITEEVNMIKKVYEFTLATSESTSTQIDFEFNTSNAEKDIFTTLNSKNITSVFITFSFNGLGKVSLNCDFFTQNATSAFCGNFMFAYVPVQMILITSGAIQLPNVYGYVESTMTSVKNMLFGTSGSITIYYEE